MRPDARNVGRVARWGLSAQLVTSPVATRSRREDYLSHCRSLRLSKTSRRFHRLGDRVLEARGLQLRL